jgi:hypothetical protein
VAQSPNCTDARGAAQRLLTADNRRDGENMIRIGRMPHTEQKACCPDQEEFIHLESLPG